MDNNKLKAIRLYLGISQTEFAAHFGLSLSVVAMSEAGHRKVSDNTTSKIAKKFRATDDFIDFLENKQRLSEESK